LELERFAKKKVLAVHHQMMLPLPLCVPQQNFDE
jgi:hypothetical protein